MDWNSVNLLLKKGVLVANVAISLLTVINSVVSLEVVPRGMRKGGRVFVAVNSMIFGSCIYRIAGKFMYYPDIPLTIFSCSIIIGLWYCSHEFLKQQQIQNPS